MDAPVMNDVEHRSVVLREELRGLSGPSREMVEGEEAVALVESAAFEALHIDNAREFATPPERASYPVSANALTRALDTERAMLEVDQMQPVSWATSYRRAHERVTARAQRARAPHPGQASVAEFLSRPYHEATRSRFLFCEANEECSFSNNPGKGWNDAIAIAHLADGQRGSCDATSDHGASIGVDRGPAVCGSGDASAVAGASSSTSASSSTGAAAGPSDAHGASGACTGGKARASPADQY